MKSTTLHSPTTLILCVLFKISQKHPMATCFCLAKTYGSWCHRSATLLWPPWNWKQKWRRLKKQHLGIDRILGKIGEFKTKRSGFFSQVLKIIFFMEIFREISWFEESYIWSCAYELVWIWHRLYIFENSIIFIYLIYIYIFDTMILVDMLPHVPPSRCIDLIVAQCRHWFPWCEGVSKSSTRNLVHREVIKDHKGTSLDSLTPLKSSSHRDVTQFLSHQTLLSFGLHELGACLCPSPYDLVFLFPPWLFETGWNWFGSCPFSINYNTVLVILDWKI